MIKKIKLHETETDIIIKQPNGTKLYFKIFYIIPSFQKSNNIKIAINKIKTHTQTTSTSIHQKLLNKILKQQQLSKPHKNYTVIKLNNPSITNDFSILSSLSNKYTITFNKKNIQTISKKYN